MTAIPSNEDQLVGGDTVQPVQSASVYAPVIAPPLHDVDSLPNHITWKRGRDRYMVQCVVHAFGSDRSDKINVGDYRTLAEAMVADARMVTRLALLGHTFRGDGAATATAPSSELGRNEVCYGDGVWFAVVCIRLCLCVTSVGCCRVGVARLKRSTTPWTKVC